MFRIELLLYARTNDVQGREMPKTEGRKDSAAWGASGREPVWVVVVWGRIVVGLLLATVGGVAFGYAWTAEDTPLWWVGAISLLTGALLVLSGLYARSYPSGLDESSAAPEESAEEVERLVPLLGALLLYKYHWITQQQLNQALRQQREEGEGKRLLGEILVSMGALTAQQLEEALKYQQSLTPEAKALV